MKKKYEILNSILFIKEQIKEKDEIDIRELIKILGPEGFDILIIMLSALSIIPLPPGTNVILGIPLLILITQQILKYEEPKLPNWLKNKKIKTATLVKAINYYEKFCAKSRKFIKPRKILPETEKCVHLTNIISFLSALSVTLPIPLGNLLPATGILCISIARTTNDELYTVLGIFISLTGITISVSVLYVFGLGLKLLFG